MKTKEGKIKALIMLGLIGMLMVVSGCVNENGVYYDSFEEGLITCFEITNTTRDCFECCSNIRVEWIFINENIRGMKCLEQCNVGV